MVIYKLSKSRDAIFYSHHDMMRLFLLSLSRAGVSVNKSKAGVPQIYFSTATCLGASSNAEYVEINTDMSAHKLAELLKTYLPDGLNIESEYDTKSRLNISKIACLAKYEIEVPNIEGVQKKISDLLSSDDFEIKIKMNNEVSTCKVKELIHNFYFDKGKLFMIASVGENSLNIVQTMYQIYHILKLDSEEINVHKTNLFASVDGRFHDIELMVLRIAK